MTIFTTGRGYSLVAGALLLAAAAMPTAALAQEAEAEDSLKISGSAAFVTDYRFRGISFSDLDAAVQPFIQLTTAPGLFVSLWGSSISDFNGATTEVDITAGWTGSLAGLSTTVGVIGYLYPGGSNTDTVELFGSVGIPLGPVTTTFGLNWQPDQSNLTRSNRYVFGTVAAGIPGAPITLKATLGNERGGLVVDQTGDKTSKWDWLIGADLSWKALTLGVAYVGTDLSTANINFSPPGTTPAIGRAN
ncbi:MAG: TorF family putative porin, partial [Sandaracinobacteroides sp.]